MVDVCEDCRLQLAPDRKTRNQRVGYMYCAARFSPHYELQCKRVAVHLLRSELASVRAQVEPTEAERDALESWLNYRKRVLAWEGGCGLPSSTLAEVAADGLLALRAREKAST